MERIVIVAYKPLPGKATALKALVMEHWSVLNKENLVSDRKPIICESANGALVEIFGWKSREAIEASHSNETIQQLWGRFAEVCEYVPIGSIEESQQLFSEFTPL